MIGVSQSSSLVNVRLTPLDDAEYAEFVRLQVEEYGRQRMNAGEWSPEEARGRAEEELRELISDSLRNTGHDFFRARDQEDRPLGWIWISPFPAFLADKRRRARWLSQITVEQSYRRRGYGKAMLVALHEWLIAQQVQELWLRVFDWNFAAQRLYAQAGYELVRKFPTDAHLRWRAPEATFSPAGD